MEGSAIFKIMDAAGSAFSAVNYNAKKEDKEVGQLTYFDNFGPLQDKEEISKEEFTRYLKDHSAKNTRIKKPAFHATCSTKGRELSHDELKDIALEIMKDLGYENNPILIYSHHDTENNHVHIVASRIGRDEKKINDSYEKKRANHALNAILNKNVGQEFNLHLNNTLQYDFNTIAQFKLLMEGFGYNIRKERDELAFYKAGKRLGAIKSGDLDRKIKAASQSSEIKEKEIRQIQALIYKYKKAHSSRLKSNKEFRYTTEKLKFHSDLTDHLNKAFGLEFVFFAGKDHDRPYGYTLIDHRNKKLYKGSEVFNLSRLADNTIYNGESERMLNRILNDKDNSRQYEALEKEGSVDEAVENSRGQGLINDKFEIASGGAGAEPKPKKKKRKQKGIGR